tara:strand:+ start:895 stop:1140 length:246 start_codon:yes stop_codon:yes gene_type:complete
MITTIILLVVLWVVVIVSLGISFINGGQMDPVVTENDDDDDDGIDILGLLDLLDPDKIAEKGIGNVGQVQNFGKRRVIIRN